MNEERYYDAYAADGYYISAPVKTNRKRRMSLREELAMPSCPACYRPGDRAGYCARCTESGAAERHQAGRRRVVVEMVRPKPKPKPVKAKRHVRTLEERQQRVVDELHRYMAETGRIPTMSEWRRSRRLPAHTEMYRLYGSWQGGLEAAGIMVGGNGLGASDGQ
jgi:hypothetical protein